MATLNADISAPSLVSFVSRQQEELRVQGDNSLEIVSCFRGVRLGQLTPKRIFYFGDLYYQLFEILVIYLLPQKCFFYTLYIVKQNTIINC